ncbi:hypothetical protein D9M70_618220 [compost metagenome]
MFFDRLRQIFEIYFREHATRVAWIARDELNWNVTLAADRHLAFFRRAVDFTNQCGQAAAKALF